MYKIRISLGQNFFVVLACHVTDHPFYSDNHPPPPRGLYTDSKAMYQHGPPLTLVR